MLKVKNLTVTINKKTIIEDINFNIKPGKITVLLGANGAGKTTIVNAINQMVKYSGNITFEDVDIKDLSVKDKAKKIAILSQQHNYPHILVKDLVSMGRNPYIDIFGNLSNQDKELINQAIKTLKIENLKDLYLDEISGGERRKAFLALILAENTKMIILDEPTTYLDIISTNELLKEIISLKEQCGKTILIIMHDLNQALDIADEIMILDKGKLIFNGSKIEALDKEIIEKTFKVKKYIIDNKIFLGM